MDVVALDLAARNSAYCLLADGRVADQAVSTGPGWRLTGWQFVRQAAEIAGAARAVFVVEDMPAVRRFDTVVRDVARLQGACVVWAAAAGLAEVVFVKPTLWQRAIPGVYRGKPAGARAAAAALGYTPPDLLGSWPLPAHGAERAAARKLAKKVESDYVDAFLLAHWATTTDLDAPSALLGRVSCAFPVVRSEVYWRALA